MASVLVPLAQGCEELEAVTVVDLLRRAGIEVVTAGLDAQPVTASRGMTLLPDMTLEMALQQSFDMVVLPGGLPGADHLEMTRGLSGCCSEMAASGCLYRRHLCGTKGAGTCRAARWQARHQLSRCARHRGHTRY